MDRVFTSNMYIQSWWNAWRF